jgi:hypothetical protein
VSEATTDHPANRRVDRIRDPAFLDGLVGLDLEALRSRRDECLAEREYLSLLRRLVQGRAEILRAELLVRTGDDHNEGPVVERLSVILAGDEPQTSSRGEALRIGLPEDELVLARRRVERLVADTGISDPAVLDDDALSAAVERLVREEREVSDARQDVIRVLDTLQDELKRRYKDDPTLALR